MKRWLNSHNWIAEQSKGILIWQAMLGGKDTVHRRLAEGQQLINALPKIPTVCLQHIDCQHNICDTVSYNAGYQVLSKNP